MKKNIETLFLMTGPNYAGKGTVTGMVIEKFPGIICEEMRKKITEIGKDVDHQEFLRREDFTTYTKMKRIQNGADYFMDQVLQKIPKTKFALVDSMRHPKEYECALTYAENVYVIAVLSCPLNASSEEKTEDLRRRYDRMVLRQTVTDKFVSFEEFVQKDAIEWRPENPDDPNAHNIEACVSLALSGKGFVVINNDDVLSLKNRFQESLFDFDLLPSI